jgi:hypothetical protein
MPQPVRVHLAQPGALRGVDDHHRHPADGQRPMRGMDPHEHAAALGGGRPSAAQIRRDRRAHVGRQRQPLGAVALAADHKLPAAPVDVVQPQPGDLPGAQAQPGQHQQDRIVSPAGAGASITTGEQTAQLARFQALRQTGQPPAGHRRHRTGQHGRHPPGQVQPAQQRPQRADNQLRRPDRPTRAGRQHKTGDVGRRDPGEIQHVTVSAAGNERADEVHVPARGAHGQSPLADQVVVVAAQQLLHQTRRSLVLDRQHTQRRQVIQQRPQRLHRAVLDIPSGPALIEIPVDHRPTQPIQPDALGAHPPVQMRQEAHVLLS